ncbi:MAG: type I methionyl aminopeptidase [Candidatus Taylorbacteria bacterium RIFCSPHIGHO2_01_FULL_51_15]|uniref:Methionine aminopeptidase n=1 Tax=Candidatus Taylorbacteria bacterium RIFCSPHIGHO2_01_FULL_51_15 TaxID=1802304 RepID=A0A1G2MEU9_9BACT|nr:MAG: type I methionyl aminopeptidase [Candidatus Taylorbacteria bacterium RIFCSPHIGHO2_01_FULL_51_15]
MGVTVKTAKEIEILREGGKRLGEILQKVAAEVKPGVSGKMLNDLAETLMREKGDSPSFLGYSPRGAKRAFPAALCVSVNDEVVHGIPNEKEKILREGDIVALDAGLIHKGLFTDSAMTIGVGKIDEGGQNLIDTTKKALAVGIGAVRAGATTGDIGFAIEKFVTSAGSFGIVRDLAGHGVGYSVHEEPLIPNFGKKGEGTALKAGMVIAIEPMLNEGKAAVKIDGDGYTYRTKDGTRSAHFEHTVVVTEKGAEILTKV